MATLQIANGATITFNSITSPVRSISLTQNGAQIDVTGLADGMKYFAVGLPNYEYTFEVIGEVTTALGTTDAATSITWPGGSAKTAVKMALLENSQKGDVDGAIMTSLKLVPVR